MPPKPKPLHERFWPKVYKPSTTEDVCWLWMATLDQCGYGLIGYERKVIRAHRAAWIIAHGNVPDGIQVLHRCDNPPCVNPDHLWLGSHADNMADASRKGRMPGRGRKLGRKAKPARVSQMNPEYKDAMRYWLKRVVTA